MAQTDPTSFFPRQRIDLQTEDELQLYMLCPECSQAIDMREFEQVLHHAEAGHDWIPLDS